MRTNELFTVLVSISDHFPHDTQSVCLTTDQASSGVCPPLGAVGGCVSGSALSLTDLFYCVTSPQVSKFLP